MLCWVRLRRPSSSREAATHRGVGATGAGGGSHTCKERKTVSHGIGVLLPGASHSQRNSHVPMFAIFQSIKSNTTCGTNYVAFYRQIEAGLALNSIGVSNSNDLLNTKNCAPALY
jgi:hypothetical protein